MPLQFHAQVPPLRETEDGVVRIAGTRIPLERIVRAFLMGMTPEQIVQDYESLAVEDVYSVINYYLHNRDDVDAYMAAAERDEARIRQEVERDYDSAGLRQRLLARRSQNAT